MKTSVMIFILTASLLLSCGCYENNTNNNLLLAQEVSVSCVANIDYKDTPEWTKGFKRIDFFKMAFNQAMSAKVSVYGGTFLGDTLNRKKISSKELKKRMEKYVDTLNFDLLKEIRFLEKWKFDGATQKFSKDVISWVPIKVWEENGKNRKHMVFYVYPENYEKGNLITRNIFYYHVWQQEYPNQYTGFDQLNFLKHILTGIKSGEIVAYDPIYLIDKSKRKFNAQQLETYIEADLEPISLNFLIHSILFEEDWYFDEKTLGITKDVKSIAFVGNKYDSETGEWSKKILFFIFPK